MFLAVPLGDMVIFRPRHVTLQSVEIRKATSVDAHCLDLADRGGAVPMVSPSRHGTVGILRRDRLFLVPLIVWDLKSRR